MAAKRRLGAAFGALLIGLFLTASPVFSPGVAYGDETDAFECDAAFYQVINGQLAEYDPATDSYDDIGPSGPKYNAMAYRIADDHLYAMRRTGNTAQEVIRMGNTGVVEVLGTVELGTNRSFYTADFGDDGLLHISRGGRDWKTLDVDTLAVTDVPELSTFISTNDVANVNGMFYGINRKGRLVKFDPTGLTWESVAEVEGLPVPANSGYGAMWSTAGGNLYAANNTGPIYQITGYSGTSPKATVVGSQPVNNSNDGASCPYAPVPEGIDDVDGAWPETTPTTPEGQAAQDDYIAEITPDSGWDVDAETDNDPSTAGEQIDYKVTLTNTGNVPIDDVDVTNSECAADLVLAGDVDQDYALDVGEVHVYWCQSDPLGQDDVDGSDISTTFTAGGDPVAGDDVDDVNDSLDTPIANNADLELTKFVTDGPENNGDGSYSLTYTIMVENNGNVTLDDVEVEDDLAAAFPDPVDFTVLGTGIPVGDCSLPTVAFNGDTATALLSGGDVLDPGERCEIDIELEVTPGAEDGPFDNSATATGLDPDDATVTEISDASDEDVDDDPTRVSFDEEPSIDVSASMGTPDNNGNGTYDIIWTVVVENNGDIQLDDAQVDLDLSDSFPDPMEFTVRDLDVTAGDCTAASTIIFNGTSATGLLEGDDTMDVDDTCTVEMELRVRPGGGGTTTLAPLATGTSPAGTDVSDDAQAVEEDLTALSTILPRCSFFREHQMIVFTWQESRTDITSPTSIVFDGSAENVVGDAQWRHHIPDGNAAVDEPLPPYMGDFYWGVPAAEGETGVTITNLDGSSYTRACNDTSPIGFDLDGSGSVDRIQGSFSFDIDADGDLDQLSEWFGPGEGILFDTRIDGEASGAHLFGDEGGLFDDGFAKLRLLDQSGDRILRGDELTGLALWVDADSDARLDDGELVTLHSQGIVAISTLHRDNRSVAITGDGARIATEDLWFAAG